MSNTLNAPDPASSEAFLKSLADVLPRGQYGLLHLRSRAYETKALIMTKSRPKTVKIKHFFLLIDQTSQCPVLALELYVYLTFEENSLSQHIFVPKADTTGLGSRRIDVAGVVAVLVDLIVKTNPGAYLAEPVAWRKALSDEDDTKTEEKSENFDSPYPTVNALRALSSKLKANPHAKGLLPQVGSKADKEQNSLDAVKVPENVISKISLFTRSANAYIFPKLEQNSGKHIADGKALFQWWMRLLDKTLLDQWRCLADIPGAERLAVQRCLPSDRWTQGNIYVDNAEAEKAPAVRRVPVFPDDPKGRFLEHLVVEGRYRTVSSRQFWEELGYRQEFRLGNVVGIIGCENLHLVKIDQSAPATGLSVSHKQYKKVVEFVKGEDYSARSDIMAMTESGLPEMFNQNGLKYHLETVEGTRIIEDRAAKTAQVVNTLSVKSKKRPVNNLTGLVKKKKV